MTHVPILPMLHHYSTIFMNIFWYIIGLQQVLFKSETVSAQLQQIFNAGTLARIICENSESIAELQLEAFKLPDKEK